MPANASSLALPPHSPGPCPKTCGVNTSLNEEQILTLSGATTYFWKSLRIPFLVPCHVISSTFTHLLPLLSPGTSHQRKLPFAQKPSPTCCTQICPHQLLHPNQPHLLPTTPPLLPQGPSNHSLVKANGCLWAPIRSLWQSLH